MADDPTKQDNRDRTRVAAAQDYEVGHFASEAGISQEQARRLIRQHGEAHGGGQEAQMN